MKNIRTLIFTLTIALGCDGSREMAPLIIHAKTQPTTNSPKAVPNKLVVSPIVENAIRKDLNKPIGVLTKADLKMVAELDLSTKEMTEIPNDFKNLSNLLTLHIHKNRLTVASGLEELTQLTTLGISDNQLSNLMGLEKLIQLKGLDLSRNTIVDAAGIENFTRLKILSLDGNKLTNLKSLERLSQLETLILSNNPEITKSQIADLQKALPKCNIRHNATK